MELRLTSLTNPPSKGVPGIPRHFVPDSASGPADRRAPYPARRACTRRPFHVQLIACERLATWFMGIRGSFTDDAQQSASELVREVSRVLTEEGLPSYIDPITPPNVYRGHLFGRSQLDHHSSRLLASVAALGTISRKSPQLALIRENPFRVAFVPVSFAPGLPTAYREQIGAVSTQIWIGSLPLLMTELTLLAGDLGIPFVGRSLSDETAEAINHSVPLYPGDPGVLADERSAWLALYEGARLAADHGIALSLAG